MSDPTDATELHIRARIEQFMGKDWMDRHRDNFTVDLFDEFLECVRVTTDPYGLDEAKQSWRDHPEAPGFATLNLNGSRVTPRIIRLAEEIKAEFGEVHVVNRYQEIASE